ncbi:MULTISPECIES: sugar porter family MFS transporter [Sphingomonas]|jgi:sugar porter (SP) family MFS transporter|uniref:MFS transporter n=1 Tax=Sphingomonas hankookensis TaxID=563996 RepID=A0ABR5YCF3_9SPHN|nr:MULTISPECIES: sugar porter family MFS transporter [Sphingomonas]KZE12248.1 MFS transporter [Sphingomonas hankookensis]PZT91061.1 MAG: MFS transporter [Sphingomonas sp.]RSV29042.1 MFS transporter [Sphingomonas sp. ABOLH]WCP70931.1 sugar porter family MFS transporter [Sphingomonas hankookensis]
MSGATHTRAVIAMSLGGLLFGFDTAVISGVTDALRSQYALSEAGLGLAVSAALWGTLVGALFSGAPGDRWGSLAVLRVIGLLYVVSAVGCAIATTLTGFIAFRVLGGLAIGASSVLVPVYIAEISSAKRRGLLVGLFQFNIVAGILVAYLSNYLVAQAVAADIAWRWKLGVAAVPAALFLILLTGLPQSPRWLSARGRSDEAADAAARLGLDAIPAAEGGGTGRLHWRAHRMPILLAIAIGLFNQLSGINAILYYLNDIFAAAGFTGVSGDVQAIAIGVANLIATVIGMGVIDRFGRRPLLIGGGIVTAIALGGVALVYMGLASPALLLPLLILFIAAFAMSQGAVIWVYLSEIFPTDVRARGQAIGSATHWVANAVLSFAFPLVAQWDRALPFWGFAAAMLLQALLVWRLFPETRGRDLEAISAELTKRISA